MSDIETVLVTGGAGFIGSHLCERLLACGYRVVAIDNFDDHYDRRRKERNLQEARAHDGYEFCELDARDTAAVRALLAGRRVSKLVHLAARAGVRPSIQNPALYAEINVVGLARILAAVVDSPVRGVVFASSSSVYGNSPCVPWKEDNPVSAPVSPYAATKRAGELLCHAMHAVNGLPVTCLRFFTVYGPRQRPDMAIHRFATRMLRGEPITLFGDGTSARDYTFVDDIVNGVEAAVARCDRLGFQIINLGNAQVTTLRQLVAALEDAVGQPATLEWLPAQAGDVDRTSADVTLAKALLGYEPRTDLQTGVRSFVAWLRSHPSEIS